MRVERERWELSAMSASTEWPVVFHESLTNSDIEKSMRIKNPTFKIKHSKALLQDVVLFPLSSVAFLIVSLNEVLIDWVDGERRLSPDVVNRIEKFRSHHHHAYVLAVAAMHTLPEQAALRELQDRYLTSSLSFLPVHNDEESIDVMINIAKVTCKPLSSEVQRRYQHLVEKQCSEATVLDILTTIGIDMHDCYVLTDGTGSLANIAAADIEKVIDCTLEPKSAETVVKFFTEQDFIP